MSTGSTEKQSSNNANKKIYFAKRLAVINGELKPEDYKVNNLCQAIVENTGFVGEINGKAKENKDKSATDALDEFQKQITKICGDCGQITTPDQLKKFANTFIVNSRNAIDKYNKHMKQNEHGLIQVSVPAKIITSSDLVGSKATYGDGQINNWDLKNGMAIISDNKINKKIPIDNICIGNYDNEKKWQHSPTLQRQTTKVVKAPYKTGQKVMETAKNISPHMQKITEHAKEIHKIISPSKKSGSNKSGPGLLDSLGNWLNSSNKKGGGYNEFDGDSGCGKVEIPQNTEY
jgi:hypothetical protein